MPNCADCHQQAVNALGTFVMIWGTMLVLYGLCLLWQRMRERRMIRDWKDLRIGQTVMIRINGLTYPYTVRRTEGVDDCRSCCFRDFRDCPRHACPEGGHFRRQREERC